MQSDSAKNWTIPSLEEDDHKRFEFQIFVNGVLVNVAPLPPSAFVEIKRMKKVTAEGLLEEFANKLREDGFVKAEDYIGRKLLDYSNKRDLNDLSELSTTATAT